MSLTLWILQLLSRMQRKQVECLRMGKLTILISQEWAASILALTWTPHQLPITIYPQTQTIIHQATQLLLTEPITGQAAVWPLNSSRAMPTNCFRWSNKSKRTSKGSPIRSINNSIDSSKSIWITFTRNERATIYMTKIYHHFNSIIWQF